MDVILKVTKGSKAGAKIAVKKDEFLIGRSPECNLCAGSNSISRKHCVIRRNGAKVTIEDLGSRNGTVVNDIKVAGPTELHSGDTLRIGSLEFLLTISTGISNQKKPQVNSVAEAVQRSAAKSPGSDIKDEDISRWLLDVDAGVSDSAKTEAFSDTQTITMDDTKSHELEAAVQEMRAEAGDLIETHEEEIHPSEDSKKDDPTKDDSSKDRGGKKKPGKLPPMSKTPATKDSREAAAEALRSWNRRR